MEVNVTNSEGFGILGGDKRQIALAESIAADGFRVFICGFDNVMFKNNVIKADLKETISKCENIILPLPVTTDGLYLKMNFSSDKILLNGDFAELLLGKRVFGGMMERLYKTSEIWNSADTADTFDYYTREDFAVQNAIPTAEGAIETAMREFPGTVHGSQCLVAGFGRVGKTLAWMLRGIGANVTVSARKPSDLAWIKAYGYIPVLTENACKKRQYDIIFNTVPSVIFNRTLLTEMSKNTLIIDLASPPGGVDFQSAEEIGVKAVCALSLPGKVAPKAAGEIIKNTIYNIIRE